MSRKSNPVRTIAEEFVRAELARVGSEQLDICAIKRRLVAIGASRTRAYAWIAEIISEGNHAQSLARKRGRLSPKKLNHGEKFEANFQRAQAIAAILNSLPTSPELRAIDAPIFPATSTLADARSILGYLHATGLTSEEVLDQCFEADGAVRNSRIALKAIETIRKCVDAELRLRRSWRESARAPLYGAHHVKRDLLCPDAAWWTEAGSASLL